MKEGGCLIAKIRAGVATICENWAQVQYFLIIHFQPLSRDGNQTEKIWQGKETFNKTRISTNDNASTNGATSEPRCNKNLMGHGMHEEGLQMF